MVRRELRQVVTDAVLGAVEVGEDGAPVFEGAAGAIFGRLRARRGDVLAATELLRDGWSNGYLYLAE